MLTGTVKWFDRKRGFGFIIRDNGSDVFVHRTGIDKSQKWLVLLQKQKVSFEIVESDKGPQAINVKVLDEQLV